jgi:hypothetical protein
MKTTNSRTETGSIRDGLKILQAACAEGAPDYLFSREMLVRYELMGLVYEASSFKTFDGWVTVYRATESGRYAFAKGVLP